MENWICQRFALSAHSGRILTVPVAIVLSFISNIVFIPDLSAAPITAPTVRVLPVTAEETSFGVRLRIEGSQSLDYSVFQLAGPRRLIVDVKNADLSSADVAEVYENALTSVEGIAGFRTIRYDLEAGTLGRLEFLLSEEFVHSSFREGNTVFVELVRPEGDRVAKEDPASAEGETELAFPPREQSAGTGPEPGPETDKKEPKKYRTVPKWTKYSFIDISMYNFDAVNIPRAKATAYGLVLVGGYRVGEYVSFEASINWLLVPDIPLPIPMVWLPSEGGFYLNLAGGMRINLVDYSSHDTVPWVSIWTVGHAVLSDYSVSGNGLTYGIGLDWKGKNGRIGQLALRIHNFDGDLEIYEGDYSIEYGKTNIRAVELIIGFSGK